MGGPPVPGHVSRRGKGYRALTALGAPEVREEPDGTGDRKAKVLSPQMPDDAGRVVSEGATRSWALALKSMARRVILRHPPPPEAGLGVPQGRWVEDPHPGVDHTGESVCLTLVLSPLLGGRLLLLRRRLGRGHDVSLRHLLLVQRPSATCSSLSGRVVPLGWIRAGPRLVDPFPPANAVDPAVRALHASTDAPDMSPPEATRQRRMLVVGEACPARRAS